MRKSTPNKLEATKVTQALKSLEVAVKTYIQERDTDLKQLVLDSTSQLVELVENDWKVFEKSNEVKFISDNNKKEVE